MGARIFVGRGVLLICALLAGGAERDAIASERLTEFTGSLAANEELVTLNTRTGVTTRVVITKPTGAPKGIFLYYPGGKGFLVKSSDKLRGTIRHRFSRRGYIGARIDVPSDARHSKSVSDTSESTPRRRAAASNPKQPKICGSWPT